MFDDSWKGLFALQELRGLAEFTNKNVDDQTIIDFLLAAGFKDLTKYEGPKPLKEYSVLLLYPESDNEGGTETYLAHVGGTDKQDAILSARTQACGNNKWPSERVDEFTVLLVTDGHITDLGEAA